MGSSVRREAKAVRRQPWAGSRERMPVPRSTHENRGHTAFAAGVQRQRDWTGDAKATTIGVMFSSLIVGAMMIGSSVLVLATSLFGAFVSVVSPMTGLMILAFLAPLPRPVIVPPPGIWVLLIAAIVAGLVLRLPIDRPRVRSPAPELLLAGAFLLYVGAHVVGSVLDGSQGAPGGLRDLLQRQTDLATGMLAFGVAFVVLRDRSPWPLIAALLLSAGLAASSSLLPSIGVQGLFDNVVDPIEVASRSAGFFFDPNYFGAYLAAAATLALACASFVRSSVLRALLVVASAAFAIALVATLSRGALLALAAGLVAIAFSRSRKGGVLAIMALGLVALVAYPLFADVRFGASEGLSDASLRAQLEASGRVNTWLAGIELFLSSPLFGIGIGQYVEASPVGIAPHNWYLGILAEGGIVGFGLWALFIASVLLALRRSSHPAQTVGYAVIATWLVASVFLDTPRFYRPTGLVMFAVAAALAADWLPKGADSSAKVTRSALIRSPDARKRVDHPRGVTIAGGPQRPGPRERGSTEHGLSS